MRSSVSRATTESPRSEKLLAVVGTGCWGIATESVIRVIRADSLKQRSSGRASRRAERRFPVDHHGDRRGLGMLGNLAHQEALTVGRHVVVVGAILEAAH